MAAAAAAVPPMDIRRVARFIEILMPHLEVEHRTEAFIHQFLRHFTAEVIPGDMIMFATRRMQMMPENLRNAIIDSGQAGTYGRLYFCGVNNRHCYKSVIVPEAPGPEAFSHISNIFKETFIQFIITTDPIYGLASPHISNIYYTRIINPATGLVQNTIMVEMERAGGTVHSLFAGIAAPIRFRTFCEITIPIFELLFILHRQYLFVHRDFKLNNILLRVPDPEEGDNAMGAGAPGLIRVPLQIIDFGMSCITLNVGGILYLIKSGSVYNFGVDCRQQQDVVTYISAFLTDFVLRSEPRLRDFLYGYLTVPLISAIGQKAVERGLSPFHASYNNTGVLLAPADRQVHFTIYNFIQQLNIELARLQGGRRRRQTRRHVRRRR